MFFWWDWILTKLLWSNSWSKIDFRYILGKFRKFLIKKNLFVDRTKSLGSKRIIWAHFVQRNFLKLSKIHPKPNLSLKFEKKIVGNFKRFLIKKNLSYFADEIQAIHDFEMTYLPSQSTIGPCIGIPPMLGLPINEKAN